MKRERVKWLEGRDEESLEMYYGINKFSAELWEERDELEVKVGKLERQVEVLRAWVEGWEEVIGGLVREKEEWKQRFLHPGVRRASLIDVVQQ